MSKRMSHERLAEICRELGFMGTRDTTHAAKELLQALKAERSKVAEIEAENGNLHEFIDRFCNQPSYTRVYTQFNDMKQRAETAEAQLAKVRELPEKWRNEPVQPLGTGFAFAATCLTTNDCAAELESLLTDKAGSGE